MAKRFTIPGHLQGIMEYYPDVFPYDLNQTQYTLLWQIIGSHKTRYLYADGCQVRPTNWFMYTFQNIKGWLGFDNHCQKEKVTYTLHKLLYYGYTKGFPQPKPSLARYALSDYLRSLANHAYNNPTTAKLQEALIAEYFRLEPHLKFDSSQKLRANHRFGEGLLPIGVEHIPLLDPQDESLIQWVIQSIEFKGIKASELSFLLHSKFADTAARYYCQKAKDTQVPSFFSLSRLFWHDPRPDYLAQSLVFNPAIAKGEAEQYISHHIQQKEYKQAFNLLRLVTDRLVLLKFILAIPE